MAEVWKDILGYEGLYQVSSLGRVKSCDRYVNHYLGKRLIGEHILRQTNNSNYYTITLAKENRKKTKRVHRLVALHFIKNDENYLEVNHIDGNSLNNNVNNLEWCNRSQNQLHAYKIGLQKPFNEKPILMIDKNGNILSRFNSLIEAENETGLCHSNIAKVCNNKRNHVGGYYFKYENL
jgi:hypothetical protein